MRLPVLVAALLGSAGCASGVMMPAEVDAASGGTHQDAPGGTPIDAPAGSIDAPGGGGTPLSLLLTEVVLAPSGGEYIEIANPGTATVDLSTYYLSDNGNYFRLPAGAPTLDTADFIVRFPAGASIAGHGVITVALDTTANFTTAYSAAPTFSVASLTMTSIAANGVPSLTNAGELIALFRWDGQTDLVKDVDLFLAGAPTAANGIVDKSGIAIDGPDSGSTTTAYANDARTIAPQATAPASGKSTKRLASEVGHETQSGGGNGIAGDDETSEDTAATWDSTGFGNPTPGMVPAAVMP